MKFDSKNISHWFHLGVITINTLVGSLARKLSSKNSKSAILLFGHKFNGNLKAIYEEIQGRENDTIGCSYLSFDPQYGNLLRQQGVSVLIATSFRDMISACRADVIVTDHGPSALLLLKSFSNIPFVDVWHGIPFKGFDHSDFALMHSYHSVFVASKSMRDIYINQYGFSSKRIVTTGYARTDQLVHHQDRETGALDALGIDTRHYRGVILFAPTWSHQAYRQEVSYMGLDEVEMLIELDRFAQAHDCLVLFRSHLNSSRTDETGFSNILFVPASVYPDTEKLLLASDLLVSDWSSVVFDYLLLLRPVIFMDSPPPFAKGFTYGPEYRFGEVVGAIDQLMRVLEAAAQNHFRLEEWDRERYRTHIDEIYGRCADGQASRRCVDRLFSLCNGMEAEEHAS